MNEQNIFFSMQIQQVITDKEHNTYLNNNNIFIFTLRLIPTSERSLKAILGGKKSKENKLSV